MRPHHSISQRCKPNTGFTTVTHDRRHSERVAGRSFVSRGSRRRRNQPTPTKTARPNHNKPKQPKKLKP